MNNYNFVFNSCLKNYTTEFIFFNTSVMRHQRGIKCHGIKLIDNKNKYGLNVN